MFHAANHISPCGVLVVEKARIVEADEELAVRAVRAARTRHRTSTAHMRLGIELLGKIGLFRTAHASPVGATALRHETRDDAVELYAIVKAFAGQLFNACNMIGCEIGAKLDDNVAAIQRQGEGFVGHDDVLFLSGDVARCRRRMDGLRKAKIIAF